MQIPPFLCSTTPFCARGSLRYCWSILAQPSSEVRKTISEYAAARKRKVPGVSKRPALLPTALRCPGQLHPNKLYSKYTPVSNYFPLTQYMKFLTIFRHFHEYPCACQLFYTKLHKNTHCAIFFRQWVFFIDLQAQGAPFPSSSRAPVSAPTGVLSPVWPL